MSSGDHIRVRRAAALAFAIASTLAGARAGYAQGTPATTKDTQVIDVVIVTAQRREENLIDVPIAVAAFSGEALERRQIDQATDLQLNVPNVSYTKTNFTGSNFQIRGIGVSSVAASGDSGVETHFNSMPIKNPRLFETEYFDVQRVEVLRGPQGTLYGRNATGGAVNVIARKPAQGVRGQRRARGRQLQRAEGEGRGEHPARRHGRGALRRHQLQARRLHRQPRSPATTSTIATSGRRAARCASRRATRPTSR